MRSWDVKLGSIPLNFPIGQAGLTLGVAQKEPGTPGQLGQAVVGSFHGGVGRDMDDGLGRYGEAVGANTTIPGLLLPEAFKATVDSFVATGVTSMRPALGYQTGSVMFIIAGQDIYTFDPTAETPAITQMTVNVSGGWAAGEEFSGSVFKFNNRMIFGVVNNGQATRYGWCLTDGTGDVTVVATGGEEVSHGASARGKAFWLRSNNQLVWAIQSAAATFPGTPHGPQVINNSPPDITWVAMIGTAVILLTSGGEILGADETALWALAGFTGDAPLDLNFGHHPKFWQDVLLIPSITGLWSYTGQTLLTRAIGGNYIQTTNVERLRGSAVSAAAAGPYGYVAQRVPGAEDHTRIYRLVRYQDQFAFHDFLEEQDTNVVAADMMTFFVQAIDQTRLYYLEHNESNDTVTLMYRNLRLPSDSGFNDFLNTMDSTVDLLKLTGQDASQSMTKMWLQVRGHFETGTPHDVAFPPSLSFEGVTVDGQTVTIASVTTSGPFAVPIVGSSAGNVLGRELSACTVKLNNPDHDTILHLPLVFDYIWVPSDTDRVTLVVTVGSDVVGNVVSLRQNSSRDLRDDLAALNSTVTTLEFYDDEHGATPWDVLVEDVKINDVPETEGVGQIDRVATIILRRL